MIDKKDRKYLVIGVMILAIILYQYCRPMSGFEKKILKQFDAIEEGDIKSIDVMIYGDKYRVTIKNRAIIKRFVDAIKTKEKVRGTGPRMKDHYYVTINTQLTSITFYFRKIVSDISPECKYGSTFEQTVNCDICTDLLFSAQSLDPVDTLKHDNFSRIENKFPVFRCEELARVIENHVDIYEKLNPKKGQVFVLE